MSNNNKVCLINMVTTGRDPKLHQALKCTAYLFQEDQQVGHLEMYFKHKTIYAEPKRIQDLQGLLQEIYGGFKGNVLTEDMNIKPAKDMRYLCSVRNFIPLMKSWFNACNVYPNKYGGYMFETTTLGFIKHIDGHWEKQRGQETRYFHNKLKIEKPYVETSAFYSGLDKAANILFRDDCSRRTERDGVFYARSIYPMWVAKQQEAV